MESYYPLIKTTHQLLAIISISGFILRFIWKQWWPRLLEKKPVRILPHINDTLLLALGIWLTLMIGQLPNTHAWLAAKIGGLLVYILLGMLALKRCSSLTGQWSAFIAAIVVYAWIVSVAISHQTMGFLA